MNSLIQELTTELKSNTQIKDSIVVKVVLESINNSVLLGVSSSDVLENALSTLDQLAQATVNENLKEVVAKFKKMAVISLTSTTGFLQTDFTQIKTLLDGTPTG
jgi:predicted component of type VI protein secretion system